MPRIYVASERKGDLSKRVDSQEYEDRPSLGRLHQDRYGIECQVESLFQDRTASWVRIVNGTRKYETETTETIEDEEHRAAGRLVANARPQLKPVVTLSSVAVPLRGRKWIDINPEKYHHDWFVVSKSQDPIAAT